MLVVASSWLGLAPARAGDPFVPGDDPVGAVQLLALANSDRAAAGLPMLELRDDVYGVAVDHSRRMAQAGDIFHNDDYFTATVRNTLGAKALGENVAMNTSAEDAHRRLMQSPGHRANLMDPRFTVVGIAVVRSADGMGYITEDFVEPTGATRPMPVVNPAPAPAPAAPAPPPAPTTTARATPATTEAAAAAAGPSTSVPPPAVTTTSRAPVAAPSAEPRATGEHAALVVAPATELAAGPLDHGPATPEAPAVRPGLVLASAVAIGQLVVVALLAARLAQRTTADL